MTKSCKTFASALVLPLMVAALLTGCEGPQGPQGEQGLQGPQGEQGPQGPAGQDANENCVQCHSSSTLILSAQLQYMTSGHATGETWERGNAGGASRYASCTRCHINEGFVNYVNGEDATLISNPTPINCRGCHLIHETGTESDLALRTDEAVTLDLTGETYDAGSSNLCVNCHQSRTSYEIPDVDGTTYDVESSHFGPHYGTQADMVLGVAGYEVAGSVSYQANLHAPTAGGPIEDACVSCHMAEPWTDQAGGHTMHVWIDEDEPHSTSCQDSNCHGEAAADWEDFDYDGFQTWVETQMAALEALLITNGALDADGEIIGSSDTPNTLDVDVAGALWNYQLIYQDHSHGIHNPRYVRALLTNSIEALTP